MQLCLERAICWKTFVFIVACKSETAISILARRFATKILQIHSRKSGMKEYEFRNVSSNTKLEKREIWTDRDYSLLQTGYR